MESFETILINPKPMAEFRNHSIECFFYTANIEQYIEPTK